jgi:hypothetical protein
MHLHNRPSGAKERRKETNEIIYSSIEGERFTYCTTRNSSYMHLDALKNGTKR